MNNLKYLILAIFFVSFLPVISARMPVEATFEFPRCTDQQEPGDHAHYAEGWHQIAGEDGQRWGSDDVYKLRRGKYLQCYCDLKGNGIQTNWWKVRPSTEGAIFGEQWNLGEYWYLYENIEYECEGREPEPSPSPTPTPTPDPNPNPDPGPQVQGSTTEAPVCTDLTPIGGVDNPHLYRKGDQADIRWWENKDKAPTVHIWYYQNEDPTNVHAVRDAENNGSYLIEGLGTLNWTFGIQPAKGCSAGEIQWIVDGDTSDWVLFTP